MQSFSTMYRLVSLRELFMLCRSLVLTMIFIMSKDQEQKICLKFCIFNEISRLKTIEFMNRQWILHHDNAPSHISMMVRNFLTKNLTNRHFSSIVFAKLGSLWLFPVLKTQIIQCTLCKAFWVNRGCKRKFSESAEGYIFCFGLRKVFWRIVKHWQNIALQKMGTILKGTK